MLLDCIAELVVVSVKVVVAFDVEVRTVDGVVCGVEALIVLLLILVVLLSVGDGVDMNVVLLLINPVDEVMLKVVVG